MCLLEVTENIEWDGHFDRGGGKIEVKFFFSMLLCQVDARTELSPSSKVQCRTIIYV